jgi:hypothetical protein
MRLRRLDEEEKLFWPRGQSILSSDSHSTKFVCLQYTLLVVAVFCFKLIPTHEGHRFGRTPFFPLVLVS